MNDEEAFFRAIADRPDDDLIRLVFADWLDENGQPDRAAYIRYHMLVGGRPPLEKVYQPERPFREWEAEWSRELTAVGARQIEFDRGLPHSCQIGLNGFLAAADRLPVIAPGLTSVDFRFTTPSKLHRLAACTAFYRLSNLRLSDSEMTGSEIWEWPVEFEDQDGGIMTEEWHTAVLAMLGSPHCPDFQELGFELLIRR